MKRTILIMATLFVCVLGLYLFNQKPSVVSDPVTTPKTATAAATDIEVTQNPLLPSDLYSIVDPSKTVPLDTIPSSYTAFVSRDYLLPSNYIPNDLIEPNVRFSYNTHDEKRKMRKVAAKALEKMFHTAEKKNILLYGVSGYRSYERQKYIYNRNVSLHGKKATDALSAKPGSSEHQTGLTIDVSAASVNCLLTERLAATREGKWLSQNAHKYGYIIRYPKGKTKITGYSYEPWHIRYVGVTVATYLYKEKLTLEEYYGVSSNKNGDEKVVDVEDPEKYESPSASPHSAATPNP